MVASLFLSHAQVVHGKLLATKGSTASYINIRTRPIATYRDIIHLNLVILYKIVHLLASSLSQIAAHEIHRVNVGGFIV